MLIPLDGVDFSIIVGYVTSDVLSNITLRSHKT